MTQNIRLTAASERRRFDGIGAVNGGGATSVLLKDYPEPQRSQILDMVYKPMFGASVSALLVEIPGDGNSTQGSMPSHMREPGDANFARGYIWWILQEAKRRNPDISLDAVAWSAPGWIGGGEFWSKDTVDYYIAWLDGLKTEYGLELDAIGCRNEKGVSLEFAKWLRAALDKSGYSEVKLHAFDNWPADKFDFVPEMAADADAMAAIDIIGAHVMYDKPNAHAPASVQELALRTGKPIWNTEDHVYKKGFDCQISIVECFNENYILSGATKVVLWYDIAGVYPVEPYAFDPPMVLAHSPWSGHYHVREALWGYAHYGQFTALGWEYLDAGCKLLDGGGSMVTMVSPEGHVSIIVETKGSVAEQDIEVAIELDIPTGDFCVWRSNAQEQFVQLAELRLDGNNLKLRLEPDSIYSFSTTRGQMKGTFAAIPQPSSFPFPYREDFSAYGEPREHGYLPRYFADIGGVFELVAHPDREGLCLRQVIPAPTISWAPDWLPYTIIGDDSWTDYEASVSVRLAAGESAALMGRVCHVGTGYGFIPKGYFLELSADGNCRLVVIRGKVDKSKLIGDAEQQALIQSGLDIGEGGEKVIARVALSGIVPHQWHRLTLRFEGDHIVGLVDGDIVLEARDQLYGTGMVGLLAGGGNSLSRPYFDDVSIAPLGGRIAPIQRTSFTRPIYATKASES